MHELSRIILDKWYKGFDCSSEEFEPFLDSIIRTYLWEKAKELEKAWSSTYKAYNDQTVAADLTKEILGLTDEPVLGGVTCDKWTKPKDSEVWCEHVIAETQLHNWMFCPICGTPRPATKTLAEKFQDRWNEGSMTPQEMMNDLVDIAQEHFKEKP